MSNRSLKDRAEWAAAHVLAAEDAVANRWPNDSTHGERYMQRVALTVQVMAAEEIADTITAAIDRSGSAS